MWAMLKTLLVQGVLAKVALRAFGWLAWLLPVGFLLKFVGLPLLAVLGVLAAPVLILLFIIGLPIFLVFIVAAGLMALVGVLLTVAISLAKILIPIAIIYWIVSWLLKSRGPEVKDAPAEPTPA
jgi:hypothetical protein